MAIRAAKRGDRAGYFAPGDHDLLYTYGYRYSLLMVRNIKTPVNGVRPEPTSPTSSWQQRTRGAAADGDARRTHLRPLPPTGGPAAPGGRPIMIGGGGG